MLKDYTMEERITRLEAEVMGDDLTKRPSLREEFINALERNRKSMIKIAVSLGIELLVMWIANYFFMLQFMQAFKK